jgi:hypothetical protein
MENILIDEAHSTLSTILCPFIFGNIRLVNPAIEARAYLTRTNSSSNIYLINPTLNNKWIMSNTSNAYNYGFDINKAQLVGKEFI